MTYNYSEITKLAEYAHAVTEALDELKTRKVQWGQQVQESLQDKLNHLQAKCPDMEAVQAARAMWFEYCVEGLEALAATPTLPPKGRSSNYGFEVQPNREWFCGTEVISAFLKRYYLGKHFPRLYRRAYCAYCRLAQRAPDSESRRFFRHHEIRLKEALYTGRL